MDPLLRLRCRILWRRHANLLNLLLAVGALFLAGYCGRRLAQSRVEASSLAVWEREIPLFPPALGLLALALLVPLHRQKLRSARENHLLACLPISQRSLASLQLLESVWGGLAFSAISLAFSVGLAGPVAELGWSWQRSLAASLDAGLLLASVAPLLAVALELLRMRRLRVTWLGYPLAFLAVVVGVRLLRHCDEVLRQLARFWREAPWPLSSPYRVFDSSSAPYHLAIPAIVSVGLLFWAHAAMRRHRGEILSFALAASTAPRGRLWRFFSKLLAPAPRVLRSLLVRDATLLSGGGYSRVRTAFVLMVAVYPIYSAAMSGWKTDLARELVSAAHALFLTIFAAYFFCLDFWKLKAPSFAIERAQPVSGRSALRAAFAITATPAVFLSLGLAPLAGPPELVDWGMISLKAGVVALLMAYFMAAFCVENYRGPFVVGETALAMTASALGLVLAFAMRIHLGFALIFPLLVGKAGSRAVAAYERAPVEWIDGVE